MQRQSIIQEQMMDEARLISYPTAIMSQSDSELWQRVLEGDSKAWATIVKRYQALVYAVATRAGLAQIDAADCFQQTWVLLYDNRKKLQDPSRLSAWLVTTAKREALRLKHHLGSDPGSDDANEQVDTAILPDDELLQMEKQAQLEAAISELDPRCRNLVDAFFFADEDKSYEEIAKSLGIATNSLGPIRRRCLERLKRILQENGYVEVRNPDKDSL
jgi:RNA polymerase sigma factor (sigma-70 family)